MHAIDTMIADSFVAMADARRGFLASSPGAPGYASAEAGLAIYAAGARSMKAPPPLLSPLI